MFLAADSLFTILTLLGTSKCGSELYRILDAVAASVEMCCCQVVICGHIKPSLSVRLNELSYFGDSWESQYTARYVGSIVGN